MHRVTLLALPVAVLLGGAACSTDANDVVVEVLPPRTSVTCAAPARTDPALGRGLLDVQGTQQSNGGYIADLRLSARGRDARVDGLELAYAWSGDENSGVTEAMSENSGAVAVGDVFLTGEDDELRVGVLENVPLLPRALAVALNDAEAGDKVSFEQIEIDIKPIVDDVVATTASTFTVDICRGCLVEPKDSCAGEGENRFNATVCRPGQDIASFTCLTGGGA